MTTETKQEVLERILAQPKPKCPNCKTEMTLWEVPPFAIGDGLGWGTPFLYICFNDECSSYTDGWKNLRENYAHNASYRYMNYPGTDQFECIPVFSPEGAKGQVIDEKTLAEQEILQEKIKQGFVTLAECYVEKNGQKVLEILLDPLTPARVMLKAAEMVGDIGDIDVIEPLINNKFPNEVIRKQVESSIQKLHNRHFTRECPFCAEIIKQRAKICKHCGKELHTK